MKPLSNYDIDKYFRRNLFYGGCISKDLLHLEERKYGNLANIRKFWIINLDDSTGEGSHWVLLSFLNPDIGVYFDSFAVDCPQEVLRFMKKHRQRNVMNENIIQDLDSTNCGYYACYVAEELCKGRLFMDVCSGYSTNEAENEKLIEEWSREVGLGKK